MIIWGDVHGDFRVWNKMLERQPAEQVTIQVGDFGLWPIAESHRADIAPYPPRVTVFCAGNHEYFPWLRPHRHAEDLVEVRPNCWYASQGLVRKIDGRTIGFLGGADSIDKAWRREHIDWFADERVTQADTDRLLRNVDAAGSIDLLITHTPPALVVEKMLEGREIWPEFHYSAQAVQIVWDKLGRPPIYCGHMHPATVFQYANCTVLPILQPIYVE